MTPRLSRVRFALITCAVLAFIAFADFHRFVLRVDAMPSDDQMAADGIVALTGGSGRRIQAAVSLLEQEAAPRLLVSGVHSSVDTKSLIAAAGGDEALYACCIDIGRLASTTEGNAEEAAKWVSENGYHSIILVTSNYHMPRAKLWFKAEKITAEIRPYPITSRIVPVNWWHNWRSFRGLVTEWAKFRVTQVLLTGT